MVRPMEKFQTKSVFDILYARAGRRHGQMRPLRPVSQIIRFSHIYEKFQVHKIEFQGDTSVRSGCSD